MSESLEVFETSYKDFKLVQKDLNIRLKKAKQRLAEDFDLLDDCAKEYSSQSKIYDDLLQMKKDIANEIKDSDDTKIKLALKDYESELNDSKKNLDAMRDSKPSYGHSLFVRLMLGRVNCKSWKDAEKIQMKNEYTKFKERTLYIFILFPLIQLFLFSKHFIFTLHQIWLSYYYMTLALRENVLKINGSHIKSWWIYHHYISIIATFVVIGWPDQDIYVNESIKLNYFLLLQGLVMFMQHRYQKRRKYARVSIGKAKQNDLDSSETLEEKPSDLKMLVPLLFVTYCCEFFLVLI